MTVPIEMASRAYISFLTGMLASGMLVLVMLRFSFFEGGASWMSLMDTATASVPIAIVVCLQVRTAAQGRTAETELQRHMSGREQKWAL
jgi:hypothetical protein